MSGVLLDSPLEGHLLLDLAPITPGFGQQLSIPFIFNFHLSELEHCGRAGPGGAGGGSAGQVHQGGRLGVSGQCAPHAGLDSLPWSASWRLLLRLPTRISAASSLLSPSMVPLRCCKLCRELCCMRPSPSSMQCLAFQGPLNAWQSGIKSGSFISNQE